MPAVSSCTLGCARCPGRSSKRRYRRCCAMGPDPSKHVLCTHSKPPTRRAARRRNPRAQSAPGLNGIAPAHWGWAHPDPHPHRDSPPVSLEQTVARHATPRHADPEKHACGHPGRIGRCACSSCRCNTRPPARTCSARTTCCSSTRPATRRRTAWRQRSRRGSAALVSARNTVMSTRNTTMSAPYARLSAPVTQL